MQNSNLNNSSYLTTYREAAESAEAASRARRLLLWATALTLGLWFVPYSDYLLYPLRLFVTFIHESGHALTALIVGAGVSSLHVHPDGSGLTWTGDTLLWDWLTLSGGYLGTTVFGAVMLQVGRLGRWRNAGRAALTAAALYILAVTLLWAHNPFDNPRMAGPDFFTLPVGLLLAALLWALGRFTAPHVANFLASFLAVQLCLNALSDLRILLYLTANNLGDNDAVFMAQHYGFPPVFWAVLWSGIALVILVLSLRSYWRATAARS